ncbi:MAG: FAD-dependent oxidoreductase, partial [Aurantimonas coralicida]|nr:FAD-dependent oxidoreductase [Aurantimonas coralicida]
MERREIAVIGGGLAGTATALALARAGFDTVLVAPDAPADRRSTALIGRSVAFLSDLGIFETLGSKAEPLAVMRLIDDTRRLLRAPTVEFRASEIGLSAFGYNVLNSDLLAALQAQAADAPQLERRDTVARSYRIEGERAVVELADGGSLAVDLVVAADGRRSPMREAAGIGLREWSYPQSAIVLNFGHRIDHRSISTEFHTRSGPFTQVPLPGRHSSLVWVEEPKLAELYAELALDKLSRMIEDRMQSILGEVTVEEPIQRFPLSGASVDRFTGDR